MVDKLSRCTVPGYDFTFRKFDEEACKTAQGLMRSAVREYRDYGLFTTEISSAQHAQAQIGGLIERMNNFLGNNPSIVKQETMRKVQGLFAPYTVGGAGITSSEVVAATKSFDAWWDSTTLLFDEIAYSKNGNPDYSFSMCR